MALPQPPPANAVDAMNIPTTLRRSIFRMVLSLVFVRHNNDKRHFARLQSGKQPAWAN
jgi:hypothetical protein